MPVIIFYPDSLLTDAVKCLGLYCRVLNIFQRKLCMKLVDLLFRLTKKAHKFYMPP